MLRLPIRRRRHAPDAILARAPRDSAGMPLCYLCGRPLGVRHGRDWHIDHIVALANGGRDVPDNLAAVHPTCNRAKSDRLVVAPASELSRAVLRTSAIVTRLARMGIHVAPVAPTPRVFGPHVVTLRVYPAPGHVRRTVEAEPEIRAALAELGAPVGVAVRYDPPVVAIEVPRRAPRMVALRDMQSSGMRLHIGTYADNAPAYVDLSTSPHVVIGGATGGGKSVLLQALAYGLAQSGARLALADGDGPTFDGMRGWAALAYDVADTSRDAIALACEVQREIDRRTPFVPQFEGDAIPPADRIVLIIDEAQLVTPSRAGREALYDIASRGRKHGIHLIVATQYVRADKIDTTITGQCGWRIALRLETETAADLIGCRGATRLAGAGDAIIAHAGVSRRCKIALGDASDWQRMPQLAQSAVPTRHAIPATAPDIVATLTAWAQSRVNAGERVTATGIRAYSIEVGRGRGVGMDTARAIRDAVGGAATAGD